MPRRSATRLLPLLAAVAAATGWAACYGPTHVECVLRCGAGQACPAGTRCGADNFCHREQNAPLCPQPGDGGATADVAGAGPATDGGRVADTMPGGSPGDGARDGGGLPSPDGRAPDGAPAPSDGPRADAPGPAPDGPPVPASGWRTLAAGARHTCGITVNGALSCWGDGRSGALGAGANTIAAAPRPVAGNWLAVAAGDRHTCGIREGGSLWCWGSNESGQLGIGSATPTSAPTMISGGNGGWTAISAAGEHTCGRRGGELWCWGSNAFGQLGIGSSSASANAPARVGAATDWTAVSTGAGHTCGLRAGALYCWGDHGGGRLGAGALSAAVRAVPADPVGGAAARWVAVAAGGGFTCAVRSDGSRWCWGHNNLGQLGCDQGTSCAGAPSALEPARADDRSDWEMLAAGETHACGRRAAQIECWGVNEEGQAGRRIGPLVVPRAAVQPAPSPYISVVAGDAHACAVAADGAAWCWGSASHGQLGESSIANRDVPVALVGGHAWRKIAAGWGNHACGVTAEGRLLCWGAGNDGQLGNGRVEDIYVPTQVPSSLSWTDVDTGLNFSCGTAGVGVLFGIYCWGSNTNGETGSNKPAPGPTRIDDGGTDNWGMVSVGRRHACAVRTIGDARTVWCWGVNGAGQAGGAPSPAVLKPTQVGTFADWNMVDAGDQHTCGLRNRELWCWGGGNGTPARIGTVNKWAAVAVGGGVACAIQKDDPLFDQVGELECGSPVTGGAAPVGPLNRIGGLWFNVAAGKHHACAYGFMPGVLQCWGENRFGQLGTGGTLPADVPENVRGDHSFLNVSVGEEFTCGITRQGGLCWGRGHRGQLGDGEGSRPLPERVKAP